MSPIAGARLLEQLRWRYAVREVSKARNSTMRLGSKRNCSMVIILQICNARYV